MIIIMMVMMIHEQMYQQGSVCLFPPSFGVFNQHDNMYMVGHKIYCNHVCLPLPPSLPPQSVCVCVCMYANALMVRIN